MRKIKLTESQLARIIDKVLKEDASEETPLVILLLLMKT
mgnify:CR=1 FL=1